tara:strand:- start:40 stop:186 length:147 start_codon:yes stop_codon:yes gene_type:complete
MKNKQGLVAAVIATLIAFTFYYMTVGGPTKIKQSEPDIPVSRAGSGVR